MRGVRGGRGGGGGRGSCRWEGVKGREERKEGRKKLGGGGRREGRR